MILFMACTLFILMDLEGTEHVYEHEVESFFWVAIWVVFCCGDKPLAPDCPLLKWRMVDR